jgi:hypothetical protein
MRRTEFDAFTSQAPWGLEIVPWCIYDTKLYTSRVTTELRFFTSMEGEGPGWTNMYMPGMLPNPLAFLIETIFVYGITTNIALGEFELSIGPKLYLRNPAWLMAIRPKWSVRPGLFIPPQMLFHASLRWGTAVELGAGLSGHLKPRAAIQVAMVGKLARPIQ